MNDDLQPIARKIRHAEARRDRTVPLDQPHPEEVNTASSSPLPPSAEPSSPTPTQNKRPEPKDEPRQMLEPEEDVTEKPTTIAGYKPEDLLTAPVTPPAPIKTEKRSATMSGLVIFLIAVGIILFLIGIVLMVLGLFLFGIIVAIVGAAAVAVSVFFPFQG